MTIHKEKMHCLLQELYEYEQLVPMTDEERLLLHEWVASGRSVHDNGSYACLDGGAPMDFLDVYREEKEEQDLVNSMEPEERRRYLLDQYGVDISSFI